MRSKRLPAVTRWNAAHIKACAPLAPNMSLMMSMPGCAVYHRRYPPPRKTHFGRATDARDQNAGTNVPSSIDPSVVPSVPMSKMASQDVTALLAQMRQQQV
jgi:hypothetical protein